jgi:hypothetical protein
MLYDLYPHRRKGVYFASARTAHKKTPAREPGQDPARGFRLYESSRTKVISMFTL